MQRVGSLAAKVIGRMFLTGLVAVLLVVVVELALRCQ